MQRVLRITIGAATALLLAACGRDTSPTGAAVESDLASLTVDPAVGAASGQASLPGFTMSPDPTYQGSVSATDQCGYSPITGRVECAPVVRDGLTITRSIAFYDASGAAQTHRDSTTRSTNTRVTVKGTTTTPKGSLAVDRASSMTVAGLGKSSTAHTLNGEEKGTTSGTLTTDRGSAAITETFSATTVNVVVPAPFTSASWPVSGTTTRSSTFTATRGGVTRTSTSSETVTYNGTSKASVVVTRGGTTRTCARDLSTHTTTCP